MIKQIMLLLLVLTCTVNANAQTIPLNSLKQVDLVNVDAEVLKYKGQTGLQVKAAKGAEKLETLVIIPDVNFKNGVIEVEVSGQPAPGAFAQARGFVGVAFRVKEAEPYEYEAFYLRPTNAREHNQVQRNHSLQYVSHPDYPWYRLRKETPEKNMSPMQI